MINIKTLLLLLAMTALSGCFSFYKSESLKNIYSATDAQKVIKKGMSMAQVNLKLGEYTNQEIDGDKIIWRYLSFDSISDLISLGSHRYITITFDNKKLVKSVRYSSKPK